jgi:hypothetical protein
LACRHSFAASCETSVALIRCLPPALHYKLEKASKLDILRKLKKRFGAKIIRDIRFRVG